MLEILNRETTISADYPGLSSEEAKVRSKEGKNRLEPKKKSSAVKIFANQFRDVLVVILLAAAAVSVLLGEAYDAAAIMVIVLLNAVLGFVQEQRTEKTLKAMSEMTAPVARVFRDGVLCDIPAEDMVRSDVFVIEEGDRIPADGVVLSQSSLMCDEAVLTGESESVAKTEYREGDPTDGIGLSHMVYMGAAVMRGNAVCRVTAIGKATQTGKISRMLDEAVLEKTPLQIRLGKLGKTLAIVCIVVCAVLFLLGVIMGESAYDMLMTGLTVAIAAIPEGLPATVTIALALAVRRILKQGALVNHLHSVETLGSATVICTDKTGTITQNKMTVTDIFCAGEAYRVTGKGLSCAGKILPIKENSENGSAALSELLGSFVICNNASVSRAVLPERNRTEAMWNTSGDSSEAALLIAAAKGGVSRETLSFRRISEIPFDSKIRMMTVAAMLDGVQTVVTKGSAEAVLELCTDYLQGDTVLPMNYLKKAELTAVAEKYAAKGLRVLGFSKAQDKKIIFQGFAAMEDSVHENVPAAIAACKRAKIKVLMLTGDHKLTAISAAKSAGILKQSSEAVTGSELDGMSDEELCEALKTKTVFARVTPEHKLRIVRALKSMGENVAMTGDGVNDAPAVKEATIGIAMGKNGTDVTKEAADLILTDDNFGTIVAAVKEGRGITLNLRKLVRYLISCNIGEVVTMFFGILIGLPPVLLPTQILLVNLATDGLPAIALGLEPTDSAVMRDRPLNDKSFFSGGLAFKIIIRGLLIGLCTLGAFVAVKNSFGGLASARTAALITLVLAQLIHAFECKSEVKTLNHIKLGDNPYLIAANAISLIALAACLAVPFLTEVFSTVRLSVLEMVVSVGFALLPSVIASVVGKIKR